MSLTYSLEVQESRAELDKVCCGASLECTTIWSAAAERSGDGAFVDSVPPADSKAASRFSRVCGTPHSIYFAIDALDGTAKIRPVGVGRDARSKLDAES